MKEEQEETNPKPEKRDRSFNKRWIWLGLGIVLVAVGVLIGFIWFANKNMLLGVLTISLVSTGIYLIFQNLRNFKEEDNIVRIEGFKRDKKPANCLNIYVRKDPVTGKPYPEKILFENLKKDQLRGQPQQCLNDDKWYYVNWWDLGKESLVPLIVPDTVYTPPSLLARYIQIPAQRKYMRHRETWQKYIGPGIVAVMCGIGMIVIIALAG